MDTIQEYEEQTGKRFRRSKAQTERGLTREEAFLEFRENSYCHPVRRVVTSTIPPEVWRDGELTLANFSERTGGRRFRMTKDQVKRGLTRQEAFAERMKQENDNGVKP